MGLAGDPETCQRPPWKVLIVEGKGKVTYGQELLDMFSKQGTRPQGTEQSGGRRWGKVRNCYYNYSKAKSKVKNKQCLNVNPLLPPKVENSYQEVNKNVIP